ncbi:MAG: hypothetical protein ACI4ST_08455, partial [Candidatus Gallimonas sp.]
KSEELNSEDGFLTSNLIEDGGFEGVSVEDAKAGAWDIDVTSSAAGTKGTAELVTDAYDGEQAFRLKGAGNDSGYPEISQDITVLPNTTYFISLRVKVNGTATSNSNIFYGLVSRDRETETVYGEQHRWSDNSVDKDKVYKTEEDEWAGYTNGFTLFNARIRTANETNVRLFIRVQKMDVTIDDVSVTYAGDLVPASANLLKNPGFEDSTGADALKDWEAISMPESGGAGSGAAAGIDDVRTSSAYTAGRSTQDKQIEGFNALYLAAYSGITEEDSIIIGQAVSVTANTQYSFYANFSKWDSPKSLAGVQSVTVGIYAADKETVLAAKNIDGADISMARYLYTGVSGNSGDNTTVYPFIKVQTIGYGAYGQGLYVDDCAFYKTSLGLPDGKTNMFTNGELAGSSDGWYEVGGSSQLGWQNKSAYISDGSVWLSQWNPYNGLLQGARLEAGKLYKVTAYVAGYLNGPQDAPFEGLNSPASILVIKGEEEEVYNTIEADLAAWQFDNIEVVAKQNVYLDTDVVYRPIELIFSVETTGDYSILIGFEGMAYYAPTDSWIWRGGMNIGGVSMYETSMEELSPIVDDGDYTDYIVNTDTTNISITDDAITVKGLTVEQFLEAAYAAPGYEMKVVDANGNEVTSGKMQSGYSVVVTKDNETVKTYSVSVSSTPGGDPGDNTGDGDNKKGGCGSVVAAGSAWAVCALAVSVVALVKKGRKNS